MRRFKFRLEPLKRLRQHEEQTAQLQVAQELQALSRLSGARAETMRELSRLEMAIAAGSNARELQSTVTAFEMTTGHLGQLDALIVEQEQRLEQARARYFEAHRQTETIERLEEKARSEYREVGFREEQRTIDELATMRSTR